MDQQRGRPVLVEFWDFCRVNSLRTLPYLKAWHERYADAGLRVIGVHTGGFPPSRDEQEVAARGAAARRRVPRGDRRAAGDLGLLRQRGLAGALPVGPDAARCSRCTTARAPTRRPSWRSSELLGVEREPLAPLRPEDEPGRPAAGADRGPARRLLRPLRGGRRVGGAGGRGRADRQRPCAGDRRRPAATRWSSTPHHTAAVLELAAGPGLVLPHDVLHPGGRSSACPRSPSRRMSRGGPVSSTRTAVPGQ